MDIVLAQLDELGIDVADRMWMPRRTTWRR
jgi:hypothetical protein